MHFFELNKIELNFELNSRLNKKRKGGLFCSNGLGFIKNKLCKIKVGIDFRECNRISQFGNHICFSYCDQRKMVVRLAFHGAHQQVLTIPQGLLLIFFQPKM